MNYGKSNLSRKKKSNLLLKRKGKRGESAYVFQSLIICFLLLIVIGAAGVSIYVKKVIDNTPEVTAKDIMPQAIQRILSIPMEPCLSNSKTLILTVFTRNMTRFHHTWGKLLLRSRTNVSTSIKVLISRELSVPVSMVLHMASISQKEPAH